jgi:hypothetical protein
LYGDDLKKRTETEDIRSIVLRKMFGPKREEVTGGWRKLRSEELYNLYSSPNIIRMIKPRSVER